MFIGLSGLVLAVAVGLCYLFGMKVDLPGWFWLLFPAVPFSAATMLYARKIGMARVVDAAECLTASLLTVPAIVMVTYLAIYAHFPLADSSLSRMDRALGFDWVGLIHWLDRYPNLLRILTEAYSSFVLQAFGIPLLLCIGGQGERGRKMLFSFVVICLIASLISVFFPALGTFSTYLPHDLSNVNPDHANRFLAQFNAVRDNPDFVLTPLQSQGILTFPSVHAALAALAVWGVWYMPWVRLPALLLNALMLISTFTDANHYLSDVIAGVVLTILVVTLTTRVTLLQPVFNRTPNRPIRPWNDVPIAEAKLR